MNVFILIRSERIPETRLDHECYSHDILGVFATKELAEKYIPEYKEEHLREYMKDDDYDDIERYLEDYGHPDDPDRDVDFDITEKEVKE